MYIGVQFSVMRSLLLFIFLPFIGFSQIGGRYAYNFLKLPVTARAASSGGTSMALWGDDIGLVYSNPAALNKSMHKNVIFNYNNYVSSINLLYAGYAHDFGANGTGMVSLSSFNYGTFKGYDQNGNSLGDFKASDLSINLNYARTFADTCFQVGGVVKTFFSQYETYRASGNALDFGIMYHNKKHLSVSLLTQNLGIIWRDYGVGSSILPVNVQLGISKKVEKAPFRLYLVYDNLLKWNVSYISPVDTTGTTSSFGTTNVADSSGFQMFSARFSSRAGNFMRHLVVGTDILLSRNFHIRLGYNFRRQYEMNIPQRRGVNGLSVGIHMNVKRFTFDYTFAKVAFAGNSSTLGMVLRF